MQVGDVVYLKSGSQDMTVKYIGEVNGKNSVICTWCIQEQFQEHTFSQEQLVKSKVSQFNK